MPVVAWELNYISDPTKLRNVIGLFIVTIFYGGILKSISMLYPAWKHRYNVTNTELSVAFSSLGPDYII